MNSEQPIFPQPAIKKASTFIAVGLSLFVAILALIWFLGALFPGSSSATYRKIAEFSGTGPGTTSAFQVADEWELRWVHNGHLEAIIWRSSEGNEDSLVEMPGKPIRQQGGVNYFKGGEYTLEVKGQADWTISIYQF